MNQDEPTSAAIRALSDASTCDPAVTRLGLLITGSTPASPVPPLVLWFDSAAAFATFLLEVVPSIYCGEDDTSELLERLESMAQVIRDESLTQAVLDELNEYLASWILIEWLGSFDDLCAADTEASQRVVEWFRADRREDGGDPVTPDEAPDFAEFLGGLFDG